MVDSKLPNYRVAAGHLREAVGVVLLGEDGQPTFPPENTSGADETVVEIATDATSHSGTIAQANTAQQVMPANDRSEAWVYNVNATTSLWISWEGDAVIDAAGSIELPPKRGWSGKITNKITAISTLVGHKYTAGERA